jgi:hypothetical protein
MLDDLGSISSTIHYQREREREERFKLEQKGQCPMKDTEELSTMYTKGVFWMPFFFKVHKSRNSFHYPK